MNVLQKLFERYEKYIFIFFLILNAFPILIGKYFPSMDGPAHLHNAFIIQDLLLGKSTFYQNFYRINSELIPNWMGHVLLVVSNWFFQPYLSEKLVLLLISLGIPFIGRLIIMKLNPYNRLISYLLLPFVYSTSFIFGFYNFSIGVFFYLITIYYFLTVGDKAYSVKQFISLLFLFTLTYFSHALVFLISLSSIGLYILFALLIQGRSSFKQVLNKVFVVFLAAFFPLLFFLDYSLSRNVLEASTYLDFGLLIEQLTSLDTLIGYNASLEKPYLIILFLVIFFLFSIQLYDRLKQGIKSVTASDFWFLLGLCMCTGYFILPNSGGGAGFISMRLSYLFFLILILWVVSYKPISNTLLLLIIPLCIFSNLKLIHYYSDVSKELNNTVASIEDISSHIPEGSTVLPVDFSQHWMMNHFSNYLGIDKKLLILDNYESTLYYFPTQMKNETFPNTILGENELGDCSKWIRSPSNKTNPASYVFVLGNLENDKEGCNQKIKIAIESFYKLNYKNEHCSLYVLN